MDTVLRQAVRRGCPVTIIYLDRKGRFTRRSITPKALAGDSLLAFCHTRHTLRRFRVAQILGAVPGE